MRTAAPFLLIVLAACGAFGSSDDDSGSTPTSADAGTDASAADANAADASAPGIRLRGVTSANPHTSLTVQSPPGLQEGDFLWATVEADGTGVTCTPNGDWKLLKEDGTLACSTSYGLAAHLYRFAGPSEPADQTPCGPALKTGATILAAYSGVDPKTPLQLNGASIVSTNVPSLTAPSLTVINGPTLLLVAFVDPNASPAAWTVPDGMTQRAANDQIALFDVTVPAGDTGPRTTTKASSFCDSAQALAVALQPKL